MKKKLNILLLSAVIGLWGTVGYRFLKNFFYKPDDALVISSSKNYAASMNIKRDTFALEPINRDPFLGKQIQKSTVLPIAYKTRKPINHKLAVVNMAVIKWPNLEYYGYIKTEKNKEMALMKIDGKTFKGYKGSKSQDIIIKDIFKDSLKVSFFNQEQIVKRATNK